MKIATIHISFPVLQIRSKVSYAALRKPTVFEQSILELISRFSNDHNYGGYTLDRVFGEMLNVPETDRMVLPSLQQLVELGLVRSNQKIDSLANVPLNALKLTDSGAEILAKKAFPGMQMSREMSHCYDPVKDMLLSETEQELLSDSPEEIFIAWEDEEAVAETLVEQSIRRKSGSSGAPNEIRQVRTESVDTRWLTRDGDLQISPDGELSIEFGDSFYDDYIRHFNSKWLVNNLLSNFLPDVQPPDKKGATKLRSFSAIAKHAESIFAAGELDLKLRLSAEKTHFLNYQPYLKHHLKIKPKTLLVIFNYPDGKDAVKIEQNDKSGGAIVFLDEKFPIAGCQYLNSDGENLFVDMFDVTINGDAYPFPLGFSLKRDHKSLNTAPFFNILDEIIDQSDDVQHQLIKLFWESPDKVWDRIKKMTS
ncbi:MAG: hypothetical protein R3C41_12755 [Calditrichia bacterium]